MKIRDIFALAAGVVSALCALLMILNGLRKLPPYAGEQWQAYGISSAGAFIGGGLALIAVAILIKSSRHD